jgi:DNA-binding GntR family transcriptional regulator
MQRGSPSLYLKVVETIRGRILNHTYPPCGRIPAAQDQAKEFNVSNIAIRIAME